LYRRFQGQGIGEELLLYALTKIVTAARAAGGKLVVVDAINETAASFYQTFYPRCAHPNAPDMVLSDGDHPIQRLCALLFCLVAWSHA
jgi:hypothetical protein